MKTNSTFSARCARPRTNTTVKFNRKPITITGNLAVLIALTTLTAITMLLINSGLLGWY